MTIDLAKTDFVNDFFSTMLPDGSILNLNIVNEDFVSDNLEECIVKAVNISVVDYNENYIPCSCVIGMGNDILQIKTDYKQYEGKVLTPDNMMYCTIEVYE